MNIDIEQMILKLRSKHPFSFTENTVIKALEQQQKEIEDRDEVIRFLLSFAPASDTTKVLKNQDPTFYYTLTYDGDIKIMNKINSIKELLNIEDEL